MFLVYRGYWELEFDQCNLVFIGRVLSCLNLVLYCKTLTVASVCGQIGRMVFYLLVNLQNNMQFCFGLYSTFIIISV